MLCEHSFTLLFIQVCSTLKDLKLKYCSNFTAEDYAKVSYKLSVYYLSVDKVCYKIIKQRLWFFNITIH